MTLFNLIYLVACMAFAFTDRFFQFSRVWQWLMWFTHDAKTLQRITGELKLAACCARHQYKPGASVFVTYTLYHAGAAYGELTYFGLTTRWPAFVLRRLTQAGERIDVSVWQKGCIAGFSNREQKTMAINVAGEFPEDVELNS